MDQVWDPGHEAGAALARVVESFGAQVLGRADMLEGLLQDDVPQLPREVALLTAAARSGIAGLLAERVQQGVSAQAAVSMAAAEMTARTAVDASGAQWAAGVFAQVLAYQAPVHSNPQAPVPPVPPAQPTVPPVSPPPVSPAPPTRVLTGGRDGVGGAVPPGPHGPATEGETVAPVGGQPLWVPPPPVGQGQQAPAFGVQGPVPSGMNGRGLAVAAVVTSLVIVVMPFFWALLPGYDAAIFWVTRLVVIAGLGAAAISVLRGSRGGTGFGLYLGVAAPLASVAIYFAADGASQTELSSARRYLLEATSVLWMLAAFAVAGIALVGLGRWRQLARHRPGPLPVLLAVAGVGFALANILAQDKFGEQEFNYIFGPGTHGWYILWGIAFLVLASLPPVLAGFLVPGSAFQQAVFSGWLVFALAWQLQDSPVKGVTAAPGLYVTWILWLAVLVGTAVLRARRPAAGADGTLTVVDAATMQTPWPPNRV